MELDIISYNNLSGASSTASLKKLVAAFFEKGIAGIRDVPGFQEKCRAYVAVAQQFSLLSEKIKQKYAPDRDTGATEGYELGAEWFKNKEGEWQIDNKKASFYAFIKDNPRNKWPLEVDLKTPYIALGELIFNIGKQVLDLIGLNASAGINLDNVIGYGRMLHYHKENHVSSTNQNWCGAHFDHGIFTGLIPAYYFRAGIEVEEPAEAGLFVIPANGNKFEKINAVDKSTLLFQIGEFGQLALHDQVYATKHQVQKTLGDIERFSFALFYSAADDDRIKSKSVLAKDTRYVDHMEQDGSISYKKWNDASCDRYRAINVTPTID